MEVATVWWVSKYVDSVIALVDDSRNTDLHGEGIQGNRDWSILSQPSSNFCEEKT